MEDNEDFFKARDEYNRGRQTRAKGNRRPHRSRADREYTRKQVIKDTDVALKSFSEILLEKQPDEDEREANQEFLQDEFSVPATGGVSAWEFWKTVETGEERLMVKNANVQYVKALAYIAAMFMWLKSHDKISLHGHLTALLAKSGMKAIQNEKQLLAAIHKVAIWQRRDTKKDKRRASATISRDIRAILWLQSQGQNPSEFVAYQEENGGGVDEWYFNYRSEHPSRPRQSSRKGTNDDTASDVFSDSISDDVDSGDVDAGDNDDVGYGDGGAGSEGGTDKVSGRRRSRASQDSLLKASKAKAEECNCITPSLCVSRDAVHRFELKELHFLVKVYEGDDSYAGATLIAAVKLPMYGPRLMHRTRLLRLLKPVFERGQSFEV